MFSEAKYFKNSQGKGTSVLRNAVRSKIYSGSDFLEQLLTQYQLYWYFYENKHWAKNNDKLLSFNYCRAIIDKVNNFLAGKNGFEINVIDIYGEQINEENVEKPIEGVLNYNWKLNKKGSFIQKLLQMGGICGTAYVFLYYNEVEKYIAYKLLDSRTVIPMFKDGNIDEILGYRVVTLLENNAKNYVQKINDYTKGKQETYYLKSIDQDAGGKFKERFEYSEINIPEISFIPIVRFDNIPKSSGYGGYSDIVDIIKLNKVYNEMAEDIKSIIDYYAQPVTVITGGTFGNLTRGLGKIWSGLPSEANVFNLGLNEDLSSSNNFLLLIKNGIHDMSGVPENVLGKTQYVSNTSAAALQILYHPIIEAADKKWLSYGESFEQLHAYTLELYSKYLKDHELFSKLLDTDFKRYIATPVFTYGLPSDRLVLLNEANLELQLKIASRREVMERLGKRNIPKILSEIESEEEAMLQNTIIETPKE
jgi:hypothetical protein